MALSDVLVTVLMLILAISLLVMCFNVLIVPALQFANAQEITILYAKIYAQKSVLDKEMLISDLEKLGFVNIEINMPSSSPDWGDEYNITIKATLKDHVYTLLNKEYTSSNVNIS